MSGSYEPIGIGPLYWEPELLASFHASSAVVTVDTGTIPSPGSVDVKLKPKLLFTKPLKSRPVADVANAVSPFIDIGDRSAVGAGKTKLIGLPGPMK